MDKWMRRWMIKYAITEVGRIYVIRWEGRFRRFIDRVSRWITGQTDSWMDGWMTY